MGQKSQNHIPVSYQSEVALIKYSAYKVIEEKENEFLKIFLLSIEFGYICRGVLQEVIKAQKSLTR